MENKDEAPVKAAPKADTRFKPGVSGNPAGTARGSRHRATLLAESLYKGECESLVRKTIELGLAGDIGALKICLDRLCPPLKSRPITFKLPPLHTVSDALSAISLIIEAAASGEILADEAEALTGMIGTFLKALEITDLEDRLCKLEQASASAKPERFDA
jgi:hypothetical protein